MNETAKHTPEPWGVVTREYQHPGEHKHVSITVVGGPENTEVLYGCGVGLCTIRDAADVEEHLANAHLIAATPDLLKVCELLVAQQTSPCKSQINLLEITKMARAAIDRATTKSSEKKGTNTSDKESKLLQALDRLQKAEKEYRYQHDLGDGSHEAGWAWDCMRKAGDNARSLISEVTAENNSPTSGNPE